MAYLALYRKYRPQSFSEVVGQRAVIKTLTNALETQKIAHAYLFCGPRGTGKTTMARLFAKALNCTKGIGNECNECENCTAIINGTHSDVYEVDAASNSGVENVRQLIEQVNFQPILGRYKVYIIDEVHSMSSSAFNALLKTLEEPPDHVIFILATTEPNKVLPTILSRVQRYDFTKVSNEDLISKMKEILVKEDITYEEGALTLIARLADGGVRDALSLLDQAISYGGKEVKENDVYVLFGLLQVADKIELIKKIHNQDVRGVLTFSKEKYDRGADIIKLHDDLINIYKDLLVFGTTREESLLSYLKPEEALQTLVTPREIRRNLNILIDQRRMYRNVNSIFDQFELTLIKLCMEDEVQVQQVPIAEKKTPVFVERQDISPSITAVDKPITPVVSEVDKENAIRISPLPEVKEQKRINTIKTSEMKFNQSDSEDKFIDINSDVIINIMVQGNKNLKETLLNDWKKLEQIPASSDLSLLARALESSQPRIACSSVVVVESLFMKDCFTINNINAQSEIKEIMNRCFGISANVVALNHVDYVDYVANFKNLLQANNLPKPKEVVLYDEVDEPKENKTNAEEFIESLKGE